MLSVNRGLKRSIHHFLMLLAAGALVASPAMAQINAVDPNDVIDSDLGTPTAAPATAPAADAASPAQDGVPTEAPAALPQKSSASPAIPTDDTYQQDDLIGAAEGGALARQILQRGNAVRGQGVGQQIGIDGRGLEKRFVLEPLHGRLDVTCH